MAVTRMKAAYCADWLQLGLDRASDDGLASRGQCNWRAVGGCGSGTGADTEWRYLLGGGETLKLDVRGGTPKGH